ncbi:HTH-type transcriptional regulator Mce2R [Vibrio stylophorae]|uniref:HTH-type transcriptional regulator Mce2R n=1 Tax=Vibrio stylophorae TaxID=659351 RepID=A0ABN8DQ01_9VIBR|nr:FadR/GntR family transcriptional regulator [Vibrio stylophorae]CAH0532219.1 HTH-type transcriptional regulator Mce2R [Vibrio stylophorae]
MDRSSTPSNRNLSHQIARSLGREILAGVFAPNDILPGEVELGIRYKVSRTAIREAIKMLAAKGMVYPRPRIGTRVMPKRNWNYLDQDLLSWIEFKQDDALVAEFQAMRRVMEPEAAALCAVNASAEDKAELVGLMAQMRALQNNFDSDTWVRIDTDFHQLIYFASGNHFVSPIGNLFKTVFENYFRLITTDHVLKLDIHQRIVDAIVIGDAQSARVATQELLSD